MPTTAHSYEDVWLASKARRYGVTTGTVEVASLQSLFHLTAEGITQLLERFHQLDTTRNGTLGIDEFTAALNLHEASPVWTQRLFSFFDADESGAIDPGDNPVAFFTQLSDAFLFEPPPLPEDILTYVASLFFFCCFFVVVFFFFLGG